MGEISLRPVKPSEVPTRGKWKNLVVNLIGEFENMESPFVEVVGFEKKDLMKIYDSFKNYIKKEKLAIDIQKMGIGCFWLRSNYFFDLALLIASLSE